MIYWLELLVVVGLSGRAVSDWIAAGWVTGMMDDGDGWPDIEPQMPRFSGLKLQPEPLWYRDAFPSKAYYIYGGVLLYWAFVIAGFRDMIATPGLVFGALGVPPVVMEMVAYANILVMFYYAGSYFALGARGTLQNR